jgi:hypothetical protein
MELIVNWNFNTQILLKVVKLLIIGSKLQMVKINALTFIQMR